MTLGTRFSSVQFMWLFVLRDWWGPPSLEKARDFALILATISLLWSTSAAAIFLAAWVLLLAPTVDHRHFLELFGLPQCYLPTLLFILATLGILWSSAGWGEGVYAIGTVVKLLALPLIIYTFSRSERGLWVFIAFLVSCTVLEALSWANWFDPHWALESTAKNVGVPVKNYITQSQEFILAAFGYGLAFIRAWSAGRKYFALLLGLLAASFLANLFFVISSRTALISFPILLLVATIRYLNLRRFLGLLLAILLMSAVTWAGSSYVRGRIDSIANEISRYQSKGEPTSVGQRLEFWKKSFEFIGAAPLCGHGTGSIRGLFKEYAIGKEAVSAVIVANPHNQTLDFAIQWGVVGVVVLWAMWLSYVCMFMAQGWISWIGLLIVSQNIIGSIFNSHISDFVEGWIFVIGVGTAAGMVLKRNFGIFPANWPGSNCRENVGGFR